MSTCPPTFATLLIALILLMTTFSSASSSNSSRIYARTGRIDLTLGSKPQNIGWRDRDDVHKNVKQALKDACPHFNDEGCGPNVKGKFAVWVSKENGAMTHEDMYVTVNSARWSQNTKIYDLLIDAVAGAADRATWPKESCFDFEQVEKDKNGKTSKEKYSFCNTVDHIAVTFPGGHSIDVTLRSSSPPGHRADSFKCEKFRIKAERYVEDLQVKIAEQVGDEDLYTMTKCEQ